MPSASEIVRKFGIPKTLHVSRETGEVSEPKTNALNEALNLRQEIIGAKMLQSTADDLDADAETKRAKRQADMAEARTRELEATIKLEELKSKTGANGTSGGGVSPLLVMLNSVLEAAQSQNQALMAEIKETRESALTQAIGTLRDEITSLKGQAMVQGATHTPADSVEGFLTRIEDVKKGIELIKGLSPGPEMTGVQGDFAQLTMLRKMNDEMILRMEDIKDRRDQLGWDRQSERERLASEERRSQRMAQTIEQALPTISALAYNRLGIETPPPSSGETNRCPDEACNGVLVLSSDSARAFCPQCGTTYNTKHE